MTDEIKPVPLLDLRAQYATIRDAVQEAIARVLESQNFILGAEVEALEREVADYSRCAFGIGVSSGTDALLAALMAITSSYSFFATAGSVARLGAVPVFVDIDPTTSNIDAQKIEAAITSKTRAIMPVHLYGQMADMDVVMDVARRHGLFVVEDAAQAIGAEWKGQRAGSIGHIGCFSFFPSKNLGAFGDGGMVTTNNGVLAERLRLLRNHGYQPKYYNKIVGGNFRLDAIQAAVLRVKLPYLDNWTTARQVNAATYRRLFREAGLTIKAESLACLKANCFERVHHPDGSTCRLNESDGVVLPSESSDCRHIYNQFVIRSARRDKLLANLKARKIGAEIYYPVPLHLQECFASLGHKEGDFPASECAAKETLALPIYPELTNEMLQTVVGAISNFYRVGAAQLAYQ